MVARNSDGTFKLTSLGVTVDEDKLQELITELGKFGMPSTADAEYAQYEKDERVFEKRRKKHLRELDRQLKDLNLKKKEQSRNPNISGIFSDEDAKTHKRLTREYDSLMDTSRGMNHLKAYRDKTDRWKVKLEKLYG